MAAIELLEQDHARQLVRKRERAQREAVVDALQLDALRAADHEAHVAPLLAPLLEELGEPLAVEGLAIAIQQRHERAVRQPAADLLVLAQLDQLQAGMAREQLLIVLDVVREGRPQPADGQDDDPHGCDTSPADAATRPDFSEDPMPDEDDAQERQINIHFSPEIMAGVYANFANVSHSDYEFTVTFARVDHEVDEEEIPGVVVSRVNLSPKFMRELIDAMEDNYSKWRTREGIKNLPEFGGEEEEE